MAILRKKGLPHNACPGLPHTESGPRQGVGEGECGDKEEVRDGRGGEGEESDLVRSGHQLGRSRHPLPCGSGQQYNLFSIVMKGIANTDNAFFGY